MFQTMNNTLMIFLTILAGLLVYLIPRLFKPGLAYQVIKRPLRGSGKGNRQGERSAGYDMY